MGQQMLERQKERGGGEGVWRRRRKKKKEKQLKQTVCSAVWAEKRDREKSGRQ